jgi:hypothetical protein
MGSIKNDNNINNDKCLICLKKVELENLVKCVRCAIKLHDYCFEKDSDAKKLNYTKCPHCQRIGSLGQDLWYKYRYEK